MRVLTKSRFIIATRNVTWQHVPAVLTTISQHVVSRPREGGEFAPAHAAVDAEGSERCRGDGRVNGDESNETSTSSDDDEDDDDEI